MVLACLLLWWVCAQSGFLVPQKAEPKEHLMDPYDAGFGQPPQLSGARKITACREDMILLPQRDSKVWLQESACAD